MIFKSFLKKKKFSIQTMFNLLERLAFPIVMISCYNVPVQNQSVYVKL